VTQPLVAVICRAPIVSEAVCGSLESVASVHAFPTSGGDMRGLLRTLNPDAVVVDSQEAADDAAEFARESRAAVVHVAVESGRLRVLEEAVWRERGDEPASAEAVRNIVIGGVLKGRSSA
jgi:hypothetical protein